jgi:hexokinase
MSRTQPFLKSHGFDIEAIDVAEMLGAFEREMVAGLDGRPGSLPMIPAYISIDRPVPVGQPVIVIDAGGTNLRVATVCFDSLGRPTIEDLAKHRMPGTAGVVTADAFYEALAAFLDPVVGKSDSIGFCFSYPAEITADCDARLLRWTKQVQVPSVVGTMVGAGLLSHLAKRGHRRRVTVLNDTVATLLAGKSAGIVRHYSAYVGFILGTGTNTAFVEHHAHIGKVKGLSPTGTMAINVESGSFGLAPRSRFDEILDATTGDPGTYTFEKMISGAYLGGVGLTILQAAARAGLFSAPAAHGLLAWQSLANKDLDDFCANPFIENGPFAALQLSADDRRTAMELGAQVYIRAALFAAVNIAAAVIKTGAGRDPLHPVGVMIDGSTYYRTLTAGLRSRVEEHLRRILGGRGIAYDLLNVDNAPIIGAAVAGLTR